MSYIKIIPEILVWARTSLGYKDEELNHKFTPSTDKYFLWEKGEACPTWKQLSDLSEFLFQPISIFFNNIIPAENKTIVKFRNINNKINNAELSPELNKEIQKALNRRDLYISLKNNLDEELIPFNYFYLKNSNQNHASFIQSIVDLKNDYPDNNRNSAKLLKKLTAKLEKKDILVFQSEKNGKKNIGLDKMRGFSIFFPSVPIIVINAGDNLHAKIFTLLHELCHLTLKEDDIFCHFFENETYCNNVVADIMMPKEVVNQFFASIEEITLEHVNNFSKNQKVSLTAIVWRLLNLKLISKLKKDEILNKIKKIPNGQNFHTPTSEETIIRNYGKLYISTVFQAYYDDKLDSSDLVNIFNTGWEKIKKIENRL